MINRLHMLFQYLFNQIRSQSRFKIHSPFVYNLYKYVIQERTQYPDFQQIEHVRQDLLSRQRFIKKTDLGARSGDDPFSQHFVRVKDIARKSSVSPRKGEFLYKLVRHYKPRTIIELGTAFGISAMYMAKGYPNSQVITLEGCSDTLNIASHNFSRLGIPNIEERCGNFNELLGQTLKKCGTVDLVFFDGNHKEEATMRYFDLCLRHANNYSIFIFDDISWSEGMRRAWEEIKKDPMVTVTVDLFTLGIVFFRKELSKEDFVLRF